MEINGGNNFKSGRMRNAQTAGRRDRGGGGGWRARCRKDGIAVMKKHIGGAG